MQYLLQQSERDAVRNIKDPVISQKDATLTKLDIYLLVLVKNGYIKSTAIFTDDGFHVSMPYPINRHKKLMVSSYVGDCYKVGFGVQCFSRSTGSCTREGQI